MCAKMEYGGNTRTNPRWLADFHSHHRVAPFPAKLDPASFTNFYGVAVTLSGSAIATATSISVTAIAPPAPSIVPTRSAGSVAIRTGAILDFGSAKFAKVTADVKYGDTTIAVAALPTALASGDTTRFDPYGNIYVPAGILVGRTFLSRDSGSALFEPVTDPSAFDEMYLTLYDVLDLRRNNDIELLRPDAATYVKENYLPQWDVYNADPGVADPPTAPTLTSGGTDGTFGVATYYGGYTWVTAGGETRLSPQASKALASTEHMTFASVAFPSGVIGRRFYVGAEAASTDVKYQGEQLTAGAYNALGPGTGGRPPAANATQSALGRQIVAIRKLYKCIKGVN